MANGTRRRPYQISSRNLACEALERRHLLASGVYISEFLAANGAGITDQDGDHSDWIEIRNNSGTTVDLSNWSLTDDDDEPSKWGFPNISLAPGEELLVFASGKDRAVAGSELHTNFQLAAEGEYLALVEPDGFTAASSFAPEYPPQRVDVSYGVAAPTESTTLVAGGTTAQVLVPPDSSLGDSWRVPTFDASSWTPGPTGIGFGVIDPPQPPAANRVMWLAADQGVITDGSGTVTGWTDAGGAHGNWIESVRGTPRKTTAAFPQGARDVIRFDGNIDGLSLVDDASLRLNPISIYLVASIDAGEQNAIFIGNYRDISGYGLGISDATARRVKWFTAPPGDALDDGSSSFPAGNLIAEKNYLLSATYDAATNNKVLRVRDEATTNETSVPGTLHSQASYAVDTQLTLGNLDFGRQFLDGDIAEVLVYSSVSNSQRDAVEAYLMNKYFGSQPGDPSSLVATDVTAAMRGVNASAYIRVPFNVAETTAFDRMTLEVRYDDGFVAYLDGIEIARRNAPGAVGLPPAFNAAATSDRAPTLTSTVERIDVTAHVPSLSAGSHVLAIHALNDTLAGADFLILPELIGEVQLSETTSYLHVATPGEPNDTDAYIGMVGDTQFSVDRGFYNAPQQVAIITFTPDATIRYTLDGSEPTATNGQVYTAPLTVNRTTTLRAAAFKTNHLASNVDTQTYIFVDDVIVQSPTGAPPAGWPSSPLPGGQVLHYGMDPDVVNNPAYSGLIRDALRSVPTISIVMEQADLFGAQGIYANPAADGREWERPTSVELIHSDGTEGFQIDAGIRIRGGQSRALANPKHAFRLFFRTEYGDGSLNYKLFDDSPVDRFDKLDLRFDQNDSWSFIGDCCGSADNAVYLRDLFARDTQLAMGQPATRGDFFHLYINGQYWGLGNTQERAEADFAASYFGGESDNYDVIKVDWGPFTVYATDGNMTAWTDFYNLIKAGVTTEAAYQRLLGNNPDGTRNPAYPVYLDVDNLIDFMLNTIYTGNLDSAISFYASRPNNWYAIRDRTGDEGFKYFVHDAELTLLNVNADRTSPPVNVGDASVLDSSPEWMWHKLLGNATFRGAVADRIQKHFFNGGVFTPEAAKSRFLARAAEIETAIIAESARWGDARRATPYTRDAEWRTLVNQLAVNPNSHFDRRAAVVVSQFTADGVFPTVAAPSLTPFGGTVAPGTSVTLAAPAGTIYYTLDGADPRISGEANTVTLVSEDTPSRVFVPKVANGGSTLGTSWMGGDPLFSDAAWTAVATGNAVGFDTNAVGVNFLPLLDFNIGAQLAAAPASTSVFIRIPFNIPNQAAIDALESLRLQAKYDDGFVAFLNGTRVAGANEPTPLAWNSAATDIHDDTAALSYVEFPVAADPSSLLHVGQNILAVQLMNRATGSSDALMVTQLLGVTSADDVAPGAIVYSGPITLAESTSLKARVKLGGTWSALVDSFFTVEMPLRVTEINYHPTDRSAAELAAGFTNDDDFEFIEVTNVSATTTVNLNGVQFIDGIQFTFGDQTLAPGESTVVVRNPAAFDFRYGPGRNVAGTYGGTPEDVRLSNSGEVITLVDSNGGIIQSFRYSDNWIAATDGDGPTLVIIDANAATTTWDTPEAWRASYQSGGSPGEEDVLLGDANGDLRVDLVDLAIVHASLGTLFDGTRASGDFNGDGAINRADAAILARNFGRAYPTGAASVVAVASAPRADAGGHRTPVVSAMPRRRPTVALSDRVLSQESLSPISSRLVVSSGRVRRFGLKANP